ncbi:CRISPR-associated endonuclease Cas2 [Veillonella sp.]|uniref:CRISPR-associated endonuclease Cas2 n=1 Tax=Veillonella sp. TaxID=1926307 RepID=UPI0029080071|nr:CRISPR-associated endonuclease Cas2 [Veillonella sp.]MDU5966512.1 CRISPR-associated endonuclease Cas2 [Veillonella sp.]
MRYLISYDISDTKTRNKVVKYLESFCYRVQYSVFLCVHAHVRVETIAKKLEILTRGDETRRLLIVSISDTAKMPIWCNETIPLEEDKILIV